MGIPLGFRTRCSPSLFSRMSGVVLLSLADWGCASFSAIPYAPKRIVLRLSTCWLRHEAYYGPRCRRPCQWPRVAPLLHFRRRSATKADPDIDLDETQVIHLDRRMLDTDQHLASGR